LGALAFEAGENFGEEKGKMMMWEKDLIVIIIKFEDKH
jgi:hypothetical protein